MIRMLISGIMVLLTLQGICQPRHYSAANVHSHNDYKQEVPLMMAYNAGFGSVEADIFLHDGALLVAHEESELDTTLTLEHLYLDSLNNFIIAHSGFPFEDTAKKLILLIDIKTEAVTTLAKLLEVLKNYPEVTASRKLVLVISGNRPPENTYLKYPPYIFFDGNPATKYKKEILPRIALMSDDFKKYSQWNGRGKIGVAEWEQLEDLISNAHKYRKPIRFWNSPDFENAWLELIRLGVDYINTDHIEEISEFLK